MALIIRRSPGMALRLIEPFYRPFDVYREIGDVVNGPFGYRYGFVPRTDIYEEEGELVVKAELGDINREDIDISLEGDYLTVKAEKKRGKEAGDVKQYTEERFFGRYFRSMTLPFPVIADKVSATFENGLLEIRLPRDVEDKARQIEVKARLPQGEEKKRPRKRKEKTS